MGVRCSNLHTKFHKHIYVHTLTLTSIHSRHHTIHTHTTQIKKICDQELVLYLYPKVKATGDSATLLLNVF